MKQVERKRFGSLIAFGIFSTGFFAPVLIAHQPVDCSERKSRAREAAILAGSVSPRSRMMNLRAIARARSARSCGRRIPKLRSVATRRGA